VDSDITLKNSLFYLVFMQLIFEENYLCNMLKVGSNSGAIRQLD
jgi:hypothetical protein